ncbi:MAG TPA: hypothetical protein VNL77_14920 [Roseiflexaceae bacterium]|nr:hypothetical protein [Roseiflexaceae bacterium]
MLEKDVNGPRSLPLRMDGEVPNLGKYAACRRVARDASKIADEVITHMAGLVGAKVRVTLEIEVDIPDGTPDHVVRIVRENSRTPKFNQAEFEEE